MSQPSSSSIPTPSQQKNSPKTPSIPKKIPPIPWAHIETVNLIEAYQEKWYSLKRGQLKASQWEEVASAVAARCGFKELSKTATQCRHKMEKLRKRYRTEKQRGTPIVWAYFDMMDMMERGPFPLSARPISLMQPSSQPSPLSASSQYNQNQRVSQSSEDDDDEDEEEINEEDEDENNKLRSINRLIRRPPMASPIFDALPLPNKYGGGSGGSGGREGQGPGVSRFLRSPMFQKRKRLYEIEVEEEEVEEEEEEEVEGGRLLSELASVVRAFGEGFVKVENMKLEMMKEAEKHRIEMEKKRMEMIQESQRCIVDAIAKTFESNKKPKMTQEDS
ncbi:hypothetical protein AQUCO_01000154v1 [Aquilegia coerulea]|uniref:Myb/SANT-like DNA-binding domain-containing protein n=1 Tax=Aquilegia coerulea TaxID=218851 RepID=A0A2G5E8J4_AQUCA|nr:hypothetical protein AQUCO_01000154v1 [Aquilegia coerulea]